MPNETDNAVPDNETPAGPSVPDLGASAPKAGEGDGEAGKKLASSEGGAQDGNSDAAKKAEAKRKLKLKIFGEEVEEDEDRVIADAQKYRAGERKLDEAAKLRKEIAAEKAAADERVKQAEMVLQAINDPKMLRQIWKAAGADDTTLVKSLAEELMAEANMSPQERALLQRERDLQAREEQIRAAEAQREMARLQQEQQQYEQAVSSKMDEIVQALGVEKPSPLLLQRIAMKLMGQLDAQVPLNHVQAQDILTELDEDYAAEHNLLWSKTPAEKLYKRIGEAKFRELAEYVAKQVPKGPPSPTSKSATPPKPPVDPNQPPQTLEEYNALMERYRLEEMKNGN